MAINNAVISEINDAIKKLRGVSAIAEKEIRQDLVEASKLMVSAIQGRAPVGTKPHSRYSTAKVLKGMKAPKGMGTVKETYQPGNLSKSFKTLLFRRSQAVFVGPKVGSTPDGYYAHFPEFGTVNQPSQGYVKEAFAASGRLTAEFAAKLMKRRIERYASIQTL